MVDCLPSLCGDHGNYRVATSLHGCDGADILFAKIVRDHGDSDDCTGVVGTSFAADYRTGIGVVDWDSIHRVVGDSGCLHGDYGGRSRVDCAGI